MPRQPRDPRLAATIHGDIGAVLAAVWYQGLFPARVRIAPIDVEKAKGHGLEIFQDTTDGIWTVIAVNHPWIPPTGEEPDDRTDTGPVEHQL